MLLPFLYIITFFSCAAEIEHSTRWNNIEPYVIISNHNMAIACNLTVNADMLDIDRQKGGWRHPLQLWLKWRVTQKNEDSDGDDQINMLVSFDFFPKGWKSTELVLYKASCAHRAQLIIPEKILLPYLLHIPVKLY